MGGKRGRLARISDDEVREPVGGLVESRGGCGDGWTIVGGSDVRRGEGWFVVGELPAALVLWVVVELIEVGPLEPWDVADPGVGSICAEVSACLPHPFHPLVKSPQNKQLDYYYVKKCLLLRKSGYRPL